MADPKDLYARSAAFAQGVLEQVDPATLAQPTPCDGWDVREAVNHLIGGQHYFAMAASGVEPPSGDEAPDRSADAVAAHQAAADAVSATFTEEVMAGMIPTVRGEVPGSMLLSIATMENVLHAWDVGRGAGLDPQVPDDLAEPVMQIVQAVTAGGRGDSFADQVEVADDASLTARIMGMAGRQP